MQIEVLLFDLGGVLVDWDGTTPLVALTDGRLDREAARRFWLESPWVARHDLGLCTVDAFADGAIAELGLSLSRSAFIDAYLGWVKGCYPGTTDLLDHLHGRYRLATLTNNNAAHFTRIAHDLDLGRYFDAVFASHEIHLKKPDRAIYDHVNAHLGVDPAHIVFFDDNIECIEAARASGWQAFHTVGLDQVKTALAGLGIDPR